MTYLLTMFVKTNFDLSSRTRVSGGKLFSEKLEKITAEAYKQAIIQGQVAGEIRTDVDPGMAAFMVDNLLMSIQFSYACDYYSERYRIYAGEDIFEKDEFVIENILRFILKYPPVTTSSRQPPLGKGAI